MFKRFWLIWSRTVDHRIGRTDDDKPNIPILKNKDANISLIIRTLIVIVNLITCLFIVVNIIHKWLFKIGQVKFRPGQKQKT